MRLNKLKRLLKVMGPGFITGASDDDPAGIGTYSQSGAMFGYSQLWTAFFSFPFMAVVQEMCGRIGLVTGKGLSGVIRKYYPRQILYLCITLLFISNSLNIGADLGAMASSAELVIGFPFALWLIFLSIVSILLQIFVPYPVYAKFLKYLTFALFSYIITALIVTKDWRNLLYSAFTPELSLSKEYIMNLVAILGTTISPYLFFWQADEEVEEEIEQGKIKAFGIGKPKINRTDIYNMRIDTTFGMFFSNMIMFFIVATAALTLHENGIYQIETADQAATALKPFAGDFAYLMFALGIIGTGLLAVPVLAGSASYAISEAFHWNAGLSKKFNRAKGFYIIIIFSVLIGIFLNFLDIMPFTLLYYSAILNGIVAPPLMVMILLISNNKKIMGKYTNSAVSNILGWGITILMFVAGLSLFIF